MSIATKTGDSGETGLLFGVRVSKNDARIHAVGDVDELCASIGIVKSMLSSKDAALDSVRKVLSCAQKNLTLLMGELSTEPEHLKEYIEKYGSITEEHLHNLDVDLATLEEFLPKQKDWVLYGDSILGAHAYFASKVCRRAERAMCALDYHKERTTIYKYINRLSDYLHLVARWFDHTANS